MRSFNYISDTFIGTTHIENQDGLLAIEDEHLCIYVVFDGVSMSENQIRGVEIAIDFIRNNYEKFADKRNYKLKELMISANDKILCSPWPDALTTYCTVVLNNDRNVLISHLGDSRIYTINENILIQETTDDVVYPGSNILTKCLGIERMSTMDFYQKTLRVESRKVLMCTDGFYQVIQREPDEFINLVKKYKEEILKSKIAELLSGKNRDDASYILIDI